MRARAAKVGAGGNRDYNPGWHTALDVHNLLDVAEAITRSALERRESRGGHFRDDFPGKDAEWARWNVSVARGPDGTMQVTRRPLDELPPELQQIVKENE